jgi:Clp amino terminal domain, pathogenicity island component
MFERYTERARSSLASYEASQHGSANIEPEHLLLGLLRENFLSFGNQLHPSIAHVSRIRQEIEKRIEKKPIYSTAIEIPLSAIGNRVLILAAEEAERLKHSHIGTEHMLLGLLRIEHTATVPSARVSFAEGPDAAVNQFLSALKRRDRAELVEFFLPIAQFVDTSGKRWAGRAEIDAGLQELLAPYAKRNSMYLVEEPLVFARDVCLAFVLWENAVRAEEAAKPIFRMALCLVHSGPE